jgi:hypothetical protein
VIGGGPLFPLLCDSGRHAGAIHSARPSTNQRIGLIMGAEISCIPCAAARVQTAATLRWP